MQYKMEKAKASYHVEERLPKQIGSDSIKKISRKIMQYKMEKAKASYHVEERLPRYFTEGCVQHVIQRGNNRDIIFVAEQDYRFYIECLQEASEINGVAIHA